MWTVKIEHAIRDFETWEAAFQRDPVGRQRSGVRRHRVFRPIDDPKYVLVDLDFDSEAEAHGFVESMRTVWSRADLSPGLARESEPAPRATIVHEVESRAY